MVSATSLTFIDRWNRREIHFSNQVRIRSIEFREKLNCWMTRSIERTRSVRSFSSLSVCCCWCSSLSQIANNSHRLCFHLFQSSTRLQVFSFESNFFFSSPFFFVSFVEQSGNDLRQGEEKKTFFSFSSRWNDEKFQQTAITRLSRIERLTWSQYGSRYE